MEHVFKPPVDTFEERLLDWLQHGGGASEAMCQAARSLRGDGRSVERALLDAGLGLRELVRGVLDVNGKYAVPFHEWWVEQGQASLLPLEAARRLGILPLALRHGRICCLSGPGGPTPSYQHGPAGHETELVVLGTVSNLESELVALYAELARVDPRHDTFAEYLLRTNVVHESHRAALLASGHSPAEQGYAALRAGASETTVYAAIAAYFNRPFLTASRLLDLASGWEERVPRTYAVDVGICGFHRFARTLTCTAIKVPDLATLPAFMAQHECTTLVTCTTTPGCFATLLDRIYGPRAGVVGAIALESPTEVEELELDDSLAGYPDIPNRFNALLLDALQSRASDIHVERYIGRIDVKYRIDGGLVRQDTPWLTVQNIQALLTKIKVDSRLDIAERRRPQDGVIRRRIGERNVDFRIAIQPTLWGENAVLRILDQRRTSAPLLDDLGFSAKSLGRFRRLAQNPQGLILLTGPTGCGKTTTLYSLLEELKSGDIKIMTAEDPIEYAIDGVQQSQVNESIGNTFDHFLRAFLRQDPDVILVGEIRDAVTAEMAIRASLTGHLVLSTLHVNDATAAVRRLFDLGVSPNLIAQTLLCVLGQRLARSVCATCGRPEAPAQDLLAEFFPSGAPTSARFSGGRGCAACRNTGYLGRIALLEFWELDVGARQLIERGATSAELLAQALRAGLQPLVRDALEKVLAGRTTLRELQSVLPYDQIRPLLAGAPPLTT